MNFRNIIKPYPSPIITGRGIDLDFPMLAGCLALLGLGLVMITSASSEVAAVQSGNTLYDGWNDPAGVNLPSGCTQIARRAPRTQTGSSLRYRR